jgi:hypothetical protein
MAQTMSRSSNAAERATVAWERHRKILSLRAGIERDFVELGGELYEFRAAENWRDLGYVSFHEYLADPTVDISRRTAYRCMRVYEIYILGLGCATVALLEAGQSKLDLMASVVTADDVDEWLNKARTLSRSDLCIELDRPVLFSDDGRKESPSLPAIEPITNDEQYEAARSRIRDAPQPLRSVLAAMVDTFESGVQRGLDEARETDDVADFITCPNCGHNFKMER